MATKNQRINVTLDREQLDVLKAIALTKDKSLSNVAQQLIIEALDKHEDMALSQLADARDHEKSDLVSHEDAWK